MATENRLVANALLGIGYESGAQPAALDQSLHPRHAQAHQPFRRQVARGLRRCGPSRAEHGLVRARAAEFATDGLIPPESGDDQLPRLLFATRAARRRLNWASAIHAATTRMPWRIRMAPYFINLLSGQAGNFANIAFSDLTENLLFGWLDVTWRRDARVRAFRGRSTAPTRAGTPPAVSSCSVPDDLPSGVGMLRPDLSAGSGGH